MAPASPNSIDTQSVTDSDTRHRKCLVGIPNSTKLLEPSPVPASAAAQEQGAELNSHLPERRPGDPPFIVSSNGRDITNGYLYFASSMQELRCRAGDAEPRSYDHEPVPIFTRRAYESPAEWMDTRWRFGVAGGYYEEPRPQHWRRQGPVDSQRMVRFRDGSSVVFGTEDPIPHVNTGDPFINQMMSIDASKEKLRRNPPIYCQVAWHEDGNQPQLVLRSTVTRLPGRSNISVSTRRHTTANERPVDAHYLADVSHRRNLSLHEDSQHTYPPRKLLNNAVIREQERKTWPEVDHTTPVQVPPLQSSWYNTDMTLDALNRKLGPIDPLVTS